METEMMTLETENKLAESRQEGLGLLEKAKQLAEAIEDDSTYSEAGHFRVAANREKKARLEVLEPARKQAYASYKEVLKLIDLSIEPFDNALRILDRAIGDYTEKQERIKREERERLRREAMRLAEEAQLRAAEEAAQSGEHDRASAILEKPVIVATPHVQEIAKVAGMSTRENWKCDPMVNIRVLCQAIANGKASIECVIPNMPVLNRMARALKGSMNVPGTLVIKENIVASTRA